MKPAVARSAIFLGSAAITGLFLINFCALIFQCGCHSLWAGAAQHCNIHTPGVRHCPWCVSGDAGFLAIPAIIIGVQALLSFGRFAWTPVTRLVLSLLAFPVFGGLLGLVFGLWHGYWT
ncbi:MAG: hypothetical protein ACRD7E_20300 [Bryobacteraceae bacterium]